MKNKSGVLLAFIGLIIATLAVCIGIIEKVPFPVSLFTIGVFIFCLATLFINLESST